MGKRSIFGAGLRLSGLTLISRVLGLIREMTKAAFMGTTYLADAFSVAFMIPNLFRRLFAENSMSVAFIPTFRDYLERDDNREETENFLSATLTFLSFLTALVVVLGIIFAPVIVPIFSKSDAAALIFETGLLTRMMFPYLFLISIAAFFQGILNTVKIFSPSGFTPILFNIIVISATYILAPRMANPARAMAVGVVVGGTVQAAFQLPFVLKQKFRFGFCSLKKAFSNDGTKKIIRLVGPTIIGMAAYQLNDIVSTALAGKAGEGVISSLQYSLRLQELILGIFAVSIGTVILPDLTAAAKKNLREDFSALLLNGIKLISLVTIPITFFALTFGREIIILIFRGHQFTDESVALTLSAFRFHIAGLFFIALNRVIAPSFYACEDTKSPTVAGIISFVVNMILAAVLVGPFKGGGIALSLSVAGLVNTIFLFVFMRRSQTVSVKKILGSSLVYLVKIFVFSVIATIPLCFLRPILLKVFAGSVNVVSFGIPLVISGIVFALLGVFLLVITRDSLLFSVVRRRGRGTK